MKRRIEKKKIALHLDDQISNSYENNINHSYLNGPRATTVMSTVRRPTIQHTPLPALADNRPNPENSPLKNLIESNIRRLSTLSGPSTMARNRILFREQQKAELRRAVIRGDYMNGAHDHVLTGEFKTTFSNWNFRKWQLIFYLSSNFTDSVMERQFIHQHLIPKLRQAAWSYDIEVICIDMKLGWNDDQDINQQVWSDSSKEIEKCRNNSCGLFFLSLQNEVYGDRPLPSHIEKRNFEDRVEACNEVELRELAKDWYLLDISADPACYRLQSPHDISSTSRSTRSARSSSSDPSSTLSYYHDHVVPQLLLLFLDIRFDKYLCRDVAVGKSFSEWEVKYAFKQDEDLHRILWFQRQITDDHSDLNYMNHPEDEVILKLYSDLREFMTKKLTKLLINDIILTFNTKYLSLLTHGGGYLSYENQWMNQGYQRLKSELDMIIQTKNQWDIDSCGLNCEGNVMREFLYHCHLAHDMCKHCYPREFLLQQAVNLTYEPNRPVHDPRDVIAKKALRNEEKKDHHNTAGGGGGSGRYNCISFAVIGERATGKSSFLAQLGNVLYELEQTNPLEISVLRPLLIRFCGTTVNSSHGMNLSSSLRRQIEHILGPYPSSKGRTDVEVLRELLAYHAVILLIDGVHHLTDELNFLLDLNPNTQTRIIISTLSSHPIAELIRKEAIPIVELPPVMDSPHPKIQLSLNSIQSQHAGGGSPGLLVPSSKSPIRSVATAQRPPPVRHGNSSSPKTLSPIRHHIQAPILPSKHQQFSPNSSPSSVSSTTTTPSSSNSSSTSLHYTPLKSKTDTTSPEMFLESKELLYYLLKHKKRLTDHQWNTLLSQIPSQSSVLYYRILSCVVECMTSIPMAIVTPERELSGLFHQFLSFIESDCCSKEACVLSLGYLSISCYGIKDNEMDDLLSLDDMLITTIAPSAASSIAPSTASSTASLASQGTQSSTSGPINRVPSRIWSKIKRKLKYFIQENIHGCNRWSNDVLKEMAQQRYLTTEQQTIKLHHTLSEYYSNKLDENIRQKRSIPSMNLLLTGSDVWDEKSVVNYRRCEESVHHLLYSNQLQGAIDEICSLEYICCCVRCDLLEKVLTYFEIIQKRLSPTPAAPLLADKTAIKRVNDYYLWLKRSYHKLKLYSYPLISITITAEEETSMARGDFIQLCQQDRYLQFNKFQSTGNGSSWIRGFSFQVMPLSETTSTKSIGTTSASAGTISSNLLSTEGLMTSFSPHLSINCVCWSPDCVYLTSGSDDCKIRIWKLLTFSLIHTLCGHDQPITSLSYNPTGLQLISGSRDHKLCLWDTSNGTLIRNFPIEHTMDITTVAWNPVYSEIATGSKDSKVILWGYESQESKGANGGSGSGNINTSSGNGGSTSGVISPDAGGTVASNGRLSTVTLKKFDDYYINQICYSPDGIELAVANFSTTVRVWNLVERKSRTYTGHKQQVCSVDWNPKFDLIASSSDDGTVQIWHAHQVSSTYVKFRQHNGKAVKTVNWCPNGEIIVSSDVDGMILIWTSKGNNEIFSRLYGHFDMISMMKWSNDSRYLLSGSKDGNMIVWDSISL